MEISRTSIQGVGMMHDCLTRSGAHFRVLEENSGARTLYAYGPTEASTAPGPDEQFATIRLDEDEADILANLLHSKPIRDRVARLEHRFTQITGDTN